MYKYAYNSNLSILVHMYLIGAETILFCAFSVILEVSRLSCSQNAKVSIWV